MRNASRRSARLSSASNPPSTAEGGARGSVSKFASKSETTRSRSRSKRQAAEPQLSRALPKRQKIEVALPYPDRKIPDWRDIRIPYEAWVDVFTYAASANATHGNSWLIDCATTCKAFAEPALAALYKSPTLTLTKPAKFKKLVALMQLDPEETTINYRTKVEELYLDINLVPATAYYPLIHPLPRLRELFITTELDQPPYRELTQTLRWSYPKEIFNALDADPPEDSTGTEAAAAPNGSDDLPQAPVRLGEAGTPGPIVKAFPTILRRWEWSERMLGGEHVRHLDDIAKVHQTPSFQKLSTVSFINFQTPSLLHELARSSGASQKPAEDADTKAAQKMADAIAELKHLRHLIFEASTILDDTLFPLLPNQLSQLTLINCWEVRPAVFSTFLHTQGRNLLSLTLSHCQSLNMEFMASLGEACPDLRHLAMNLSYYRLHTSVNDSDPMYDYVLLPSQIPSWPSGIRTIDFENIRDWNRSRSAETAEMFLNSLVRNAERLQDLRHISIKMVLDIPWQNRAKLRTEWGPRMEKVFLRRSEPPRDWTRSGEESKSEEYGSPEGGRRRRSRKPASPARRSGRLAPKGRGARNASERLRDKHGRLDYRDPDTDHDDLTASEDDNDEKDSPAGGDDDDARSREDGEAELYIQGLCHTVNIQFDNQKPRELQYGMEDFQDGGTDSEDEWDGDEDEDETVFVWR